MHSTRPLRHAACVPGLLLGTLLVAAAAPGPAVYRTSHVTLSWPGTQAGYVLECAGTLPATDWASVMPAAVLVGDRFTVTVPAVSATRFFRLRTP